MAQKGSGDSDAATAALKDKGNELFKGGNYLKAAATYTQAIKLDPSNATLYSNRAAAFLNLVKLNKALAYAETAIYLNPQWEKGYFRKGCMEKFDDALAAFQKALQLNPQSSEVSRKIKRIEQLVREKSRAEEVENLRSNVDMSKHLGKVKSELVRYFCSVEPVFTSICNISYIPLVRRLSFNI